MELGWLERQGTRVSTAHDVVADEVLEQVLRDGSSVRERELEAVLAGALPAPHILGRFAVAFQRVSAAIELDEVVARVQTLSASWLRKNAVALGRSLSAADPEFTGYALGTVLAGPPWNDLAVELWDTLVGPWLTAHGSKEEARHLLHKALRGVESKDSPALVAAALNWLETNPLLPISRLVAGPLLKRKDLGQHAQAAIDHAFKWVGTYGDEFDAQFVLAPLLGRADLGQRAPAVIGHALKWLGIHGDTPDARSVLAPLLEWTDLGQHAQTAITHALKSLDTHGNNPDPGFVLAPLLKRTDLGQHAQAAI